MEKQTSAPWLHALLTRVLNPQQDMIAFFESIVARHDIVRVPTIKANYIVNDPDAIHHILLTNFNNYTKDGTSYERIQEVIGKGLITTSGEEWLCRRKQHQPFFHDKHLINYVGTIQKYTEKLLSKLTQKPESTPNLTEELLALVMNISAEILLGVDVSDHSLELVRMFNIMNYYAVKSITLWKWLPTLKNLRFQVAKKYIDNFILNSLKQTSLANEPLLKMLLDKNQAGDFLLPNEQILGEVKNFFIAGHETTGNALSWTLYCLAKNPYTLQQVNDEIQHVLGSNLPDFTNINNLPYLEIAIQESLRLYPPIWIFTRQALEEDILNNYRIPAGAIINIIPYLIHRHPQYWNQPSVYYPERFLVKDGMARPKCAYIPFGFGPRVCIGRQLAMLNIKIILIMLLQRFEIQLPHKNYSVQPLPLITLKPKKDLRLKIKLKH